MKKYYHDLDIARALGQKLTDNDVTVYILSKGKEITVLVKEAKPTISQLVLKNDDLQIKSIIEVSMLVGDLKPEEKD